VSQVDQRNATSRADAQLLAPARRLAALRAVETLNTLIDEDRAAASDSADTKPEKPKKPATPPTPHSAPAQATGTKPGSSKPSKSAAPPKQQAASSAAAVTPSGEEVLLEVRGSALATDLERWGERLVVLGDRVELRDRNGQVRQQVRGDEIADVVVAKRLTGVTVTIEAGDGTTLEMKGLRPEQAEEIRGVVMSQTRRSGPVDPERPTAKQRTRPALDEAGLISKLEALHAAGVLTDQELSEKRTVVRRLAGDDSLAATPR
jgi:hypothetical protein